MCKLSTQGSSDSDRVCFPVACSLWGTVVQLYPSLNTGNNQLFRKEKKSPMEDNIRESYKTQYFRIIQGGKTVLVGCLKDDSGRSKEKLFLNVLFWFCGNACQSTVATQEKTQTSFVELMYQLTPLLLSLLPEIATFRRSMELTDSHHLGFWVRGSSDQQRLKELLLSR